MSIFVVTGAPCSGKSTYVKEHAVQADMIYDYDLLQQAVTELPAHEEPSAVQHDLNMEMRSCFIDFALEHKAETFWLICAKPTVKLKEMLGSDAVYIHLDTSEEECLRRLEQDDSRKDKAVWKARIHRYFHEDEDNARSFLFLMAELEAMR